MQTIKSCIQEIFQKFDVIGIVDCDLYENSWVNLWIDLKKLHQIEYKDNQRIIIKSTVDYYKSSKHGIILQSLQNIINEIDIPNFFICFITTNKEIKNEYEFVHKNYSYDSNQFHLYFCDGDFTRKNSNNIDPFTKIQNFDKDKINSLLSLSNKEKEILFKNKNFCIIPWISMMIDTNSKVKPCCIYQENVGDLKNQSLKEIWNNKNYQEIRKKMISNQEVPGCVSCQKNENLGRDSLRKSSNREFLDHVKKVEKTQDDGFLENFELVFLDSRFNNLCNLSCRMCNEVSSSSWHKPGVKMGLVDKSSPVYLSASKYPGELFDQIKPHIDTIEKIYFAGGEPLIIDEFYQILTYLDENKKHNVKLVYNTNLTKKNLKDKNIFDYWKNFKNISVGASLDGEYNRGKYLRSGTVWNDVIEFRKEMLNLRPDIDFSVSATLSIINCLHVVDFHKNWVEQGFINPEDFNLNLLFSPNYLRVDNAPESLKEKIRKKYYDHLDWLRPIDKLGRVTAGFESVILHIDNKNNFDKNNFWKNINLFDNYYKTDLLETFPELIDLK